jgi:hypothetical protein
VLGGLPEWVEGDLVSHRAYLFESATLFLLKVEPGVEVGAGVVEAPGLGHMPDRDQHVCSIATIPLTGLVVLGCAGPLPPDRCPCFGRPADSLLPGHAQAAR